MLNPNDNRPPNTMTEIWVQLEMVAGAKLGLQCTNELDDVVRGVRPGSAAEAAGLRPGDKRARRGTHRPGLDPRQGCSHLWSA